MSAEVAKHFSQKYLARRPGSTWTACKRLTGILPPRPKRGGFNIPDALPVRDPDAVAAKPPSPAALRTADLFATALAAPRSDTASVQTGARNRIDPSMGKSGCFCMAFCTGTGLHAAVGLRMQLRQQQAVPSRFMALVKGIQQMLKCLTNCTALPWLCPCPLYIAVGLLSSVCHALQLLSRHVPCCRSEGCESGCGHAQAQHGQAQG